jgi:hypothetical protein
MRLTKGGIGRDARQDERQNLSLTYILTKLNLTDIPTKGVITQETLDKMS